jgi:hypothetical protein
MDEVGVIEHCSCFGIPIGPSSAYCSLVACAFEIFSLRRAKVFAGITERDLQFDQFVAADVFVDEVMPADVRGIIVTRAFPIREDVVFWMPQFVLFTVVDPAEPPVDHGGRTVWHVRGGGDMMHSILVYRIAGFERKIFVFQKAA